MPFSKRRLHELGAVVRQGRPRRPLVTYGTMPNAILSEKLIETPQLCCRLHVKWVKWGSDKSAACNIGSTLHAVTESKDVGGYSLPVQQSVYINLVAAVSKLSLAMAQC